jgi:hypothetical protein
MKIFTKAFWALGFLLTGIMIQIFPGFSSNPAVAAWHTVVAMILYIMSLFLFIYIIFYGPKNEPGGNDKRENRR